MANTLVDLGGGNLAVRMVGAQFVRKPPAELFDSWSKLRVAVLLTIADSGASLTGTPRLSFGLCSGSTNIPGDASVTHFVGCMTNSGTWTRDAGPARYRMANSWRPTKYAGATLSFGSGTFSNSSNFVFHAGAGGLSMFILDITKGSPNYTMALFHYLGGVTAPVATQADFLTVSAMGVPAFTNHGYQTAQTVAVDEGADGTLDHACMWWQLANPVDLVAWRVRKLL